MVTVEQFDVGDAARMALALEVRTRVFVEEQSVPLDLEIDEHDRDDGAAVHVIVREAGEAVGTGRFFVRDDGAVQIGRMAVLERARGRGVGAAMLRALMSEARRRGFRRARLDAQLHARKFYRDHGFVEEGEQFLDAGIVHQTMTRVLESERA